MANGLFALAVGILGGEILIIILMLGVVAYEFYRRLARRR